MNSTPYRFVAVATVFGLAIAQSACGGHGLDDDETDIGPSEASATAEMADGERLYKQSCALCHNGIDPAAPKLASIGMMNPDAIQAALTTGKMAQQGSQLAEAKRDELVAWLTRNQEDAGDWLGALACKAEAPGRLVGEPYLTEWDFGPFNHRVQSCSSLTAENASALTEVWSIGFPGTSTMRSQPVIMGDSLVLAVADTKTVYSFDRESGCLFRMPSLTGEDLEHSRWSRILVENVSRFARHRRSSDPTWPSFG